jgi:DNA polymerase-3 subunit epsilon
LADLGTPLCDVTFCVIDLETTGGNPETERITEIGAAKVRGGEVVGTFQTLINPGRAIPPAITVLTGISQSMVSAAPRIEAVLGSLSDFVGDSVIVGHNVRFDLGFLRAAYLRDQRQPLANESVDTVSLARRLVRDEVRNCRLGTLARHFRFPHQPSHRALEDVLATVDLLHLLLERAGRLGVTGLDDLRQLPTLARSQHLSKLHLTERLPRSPGVYLFRNHAGTVLYVGKATNLRSRVRSYFSTDQRRTTQRLLTETVRVDHKRCANEFEARVLEIRLIHHLRPQYNREANRFDGQVYVRFSLGERAPRLSVVRRATDPTSLYLGPIRSRSGAQGVIDAIHTVVPLRRCTARPGRSRRAGPCLPAQMGVSYCTCLETFDPIRYGEIVRHATTALLHNPNLLTAPLAERMVALAQAERFEEAAETRDRLSVLSEVLERRQRSDSLRSAERLILRHRNGIALELRRGLLTRMWVPPAVKDPALGPITARPVEAVPADPGPPDAAPLPPDLVDEFNAVERWLRAEIESLRVERVEGSWSSPLQRIAVVPRPR